MKPWQEERELMERIALAVWRNRISPLFDVARRIYLVDADAGAPCDAGEFHTFSNHLAGKIGLLSELRVDTLICGAISKELSLLLITHGIVVIPFIAGMTSRVLSAYLKTGLSHPTFCMPGCRNAGRHMDSMKRSILTTRPTRKTS